MQNKLFVIDDFYSKPHEVRQMAIASDNWIRTDASGNRRHSWETQKCYFNDAIKARFEGMIGNKIVIDPARMGFGSFAFYPDDGEVDLTTHFDDTEWAAIIYLVPDELCQGGFSLFRHKSTQLSGPPTDKELAELGFESYQQWEEQSYYPDKLKPNEWEETLHISMRFNRLVLVQASRLFHRASSGFGTSPENGRLTQRFFFEEVDS